jgi:hypothetical protein
VPSARKKTSQREPSTASGRIKKKVEEITSPSKAQNLKFWDHDEPHLTIFGDAERIAKVTRPRRMQDLYHACLYDDDELASLVPGSTTEFVPQTMASNIVKRQVDTFVAKIAKNRPVPMGLTTAGNYSQQRRAKKLSQAFAGVLDNVDFWATREMRLRDGACFGDGFAYNFRRGRKLYHHRFFPWEVEVDPREGQYGRPRVVRFRRYVDCVELQDQFPDFADEIEQSQQRADNDKLILGADDTADLRLLRGIWVLPTEDGKKNGHFALCVSNATLVMKDYVRDYVPFSRFTFLPPLVGWRGQGMVKQLSGLQFEVNAIGMRLQEQGYMAGAYWLVDDNTGIETDTLDNGVGTVVRYRGSKPEYYTPAPWHPSLFDYYLNLRGRFAAEESRISELATRGEKPAGLDSGAAQRVYHDIEAEGFVPQGRADERDVIATCWQLFDLMEEIHDEAGTLDETGEDRKKPEPYVIRSETRAHGRAILEDFSYEDVRLDKEKFVLRVFPTSFLSGTPADQVQMVRDLMKDGFFTQDEAMALLDFPDLQRVMNLRGAARRNIERLLEKIKDAKDPAKVYEYPEPAWNLELCKALALQCYLEAKLDGVEEANLQKILQFATDAQAQIDNPEQKPQSDIEQEAAAGEAALDVGAIDPSMGDPALDPSLDPAMAEQVALPDEQPLPANAVAPEVMPGQGV